MSKKLKLFFIVALFFIILTPQISQATMAVNEMIINPETKECTWFNSGDECQECEKPRGWVTYSGGDESYVEGEECPLGYKRIKDLKINCHVRDWRAFSNAMCSGFIASRYAFWYKIFPIILIGLIIILIIFLKKRKK